MSLLLGALRASPCTADGQKNGAPDQEGSHHSYEVYLANYYYGAPAFSLHVSLATSAPKHATQRTLALLYGGLFTRVRGSSVLGSSAMEHQNKRRISP